MSDDPDHARPEDGAELTPDQAKRRDALRRLALYGAYSAPILIGMLKSEKAGAIFTF